MRALRQSLGLDHPLVPLEAVTEAEAGAWLNEFAALEHQGAYFFCSTSILTEAAK
jgi:hypothetical protein